MRRQLIAVILLIAGLSASCFVASQRARFESRNKAVEIIIDYDEIQQIAASSGMTTSEVARKFKSAGATSIAISEQTFGESIDSRNTVAYGPRHFRVTDPNIASHLKMALPKLSGIIVSTPVNPGSSGALNSLTFGVDIPNDYIEQIPIGLPQEGLKTAKAAGLIPVARLVNYPGATPNAISQILADVNNSDIHTVIFSGDQVLGFKGAIKDTARAFEANGINFGRVEFSKQKGEMTLAVNMPRNIISVHSITQNEMPEMDVPSIVERFQKAVRERGVRMIYLRMYETASSDIVGDNADYINKIASGIIKGGYSLKTAHPIAELAIPQWLKSAAGVGVASGAILLILALIDLSAVAMVIWSFLLIAICAGLPWAGPMGQKAVALLAALVFPVLAAVNVCKGAPDFPKTMAMPYMRIICRFAGAVMTVVVGGMLIVGLLSESSFMLRIDQFAGVKLAHLLPVLAVALLFSGRMVWNKDTWANQKNKLIATFKEVSSNPILIWQVGLMALLMIIVGVMVARSGNDAGIGVSGAELKFRAILDKVMYVRPRTKEFLIGYPTLILGIALALKGRRSWSAPLIVIGTIGLISTLNTFCHIHTPIALSLFRVLNGALVGAVIGLVLCRLVRGQVS